MSMKPKRMLDFGQFDLGQFDLGQFWVSSFFLDDSGQFDLGRKTEKAPEIISQREEHDWQKGLPMAPRMVWRNIKPLQKHPTTTNHHLRPSRPGLGRRSTGTKRHSLRTHIPEPRNVAASHHQQVWVETEMHRRVETEGRSGRSSRP